VLRAVLRWKRNELNEVVGLWTVDGGRGWEQCYGGRGMG